VCDNVIVIVIISNNNRGNWNHLKSVQKIPEHHTGEARNQGTANNCHYGYCTYTAESVDVDVQNSCNTLYPRNMVCFRHIIVNTLHR
jgi:hypothetical protein